MSKAGAAPDILKGLLDESFAILDHAGIDARHCPECDGSRVDKNPLTVEQRAVVEREIGGPADFQRAVLKDAIVEIFAVEPDCAVADMHVNIFHGLTLPRQAGCKAFVGARRPSRHV